MRFPLAFSAAGAAIRSGGAPEVPICYLLSPMAPGGGSVTNRGQIDDFPAEGR
jgi:hypothetical protein